MVRKVGVEVDKEWLEAKISLSCSKAARFLANKCPILSSRDPDFEDDVFQFCFLELWRAVKKKGFIPEDKWFDRVAILRAKGYFREGSMVKRGVFRHFSTWECPDCGLKTNKVKWGKVGSEKTCRCGRKIDWVVTVPHTMSEAVHEWKLGKRSSKDPECLSIGRADARMDIEEIIGCVSSVHQKVVIGRLRGREVRDIGLDIGLSGSRVSLLYREAIRVIRNRFSTSVVKTFQGS